MTGSVKRRSERYLSFSGNGGIGGAQAPDETGLATALSIATRVLRVPLAQHQLELVEGFQACHSLLAHGDSS